MKTKVTGIAVAIFFMAFFVSTNAWAAPICPDTMWLFSSNTTDEWAVKKFDSANAAYNNICIVGKIANDNDCKANYATQGDFIAYILGTDHLVDATISDMKCVCGTKVDKNQYFLCLAKAEKTVLASGFSIEFRDINFNAWCSYGPPVPIPDSSSGLDSNDNCMLDSAENEQESTGSTDTDDDGIEDSMDDCPDTAAGAAVDAHGCSGAQNADSDADGVVDRSDNCPNTSNADQADTNGNGVGDACDASAAATTAITPPTSSVSEGGMCAMSPIASFNPIGALFVLGALVMMAGKRKK